MDHIDLILTLVAIFGLLLLSGFFSGSETSVTAASRPRMHLLAKQGNQAAGRINALWDKKEKMLGAILLGNNLVNILASALATSLFIHHFDEAGILYATLSMTLLVLIFGEVLPKTYALTHSDRMALFVAPILTVIVFVFWPVTHMVQLLVSAILRLLRIDQTLALARQNEAREEELRGAIALHGHGGGEESRHEQAMLRSILDLGEVSVAEIMTYRRNVIAIDIDQEPAKILEEVLNSQHTRVPLWQGTPENIIGVLHAKALLRALKASEGKLQELDILAIASKPWFIPETSDLLSQLQAFRSRREHFAIVVDEYGEMLGVVTLEDILEEIVGNIGDEHDVSVEGVEAFRDGTVVAEGRVTLRDLNRKFDWELPDDLASTLAGLILEEARHIPEVGQQFAFHGFRFEILGRQRNQITLVKITPPTS